VRTYRARYRNGLLRRQKSMYCSTCGSVVAQHVSYCNRCGAKTGGVRDEAQDSAGGLSLDSLIWAIVSLFIAGLGVIIGLMVVMKEVVGFDLSIVLAVTGLSFLLLVAVEVVLTGMLLSGRKRAWRAGDSARTQEQTTRELEGARAHALPEPVPSVTEQTTRTFEPLYSERKSK
jgi:uncharacterized paraquat-inducible protein A